MAREAWGRAVASSSQRDNEKAAEELQQGPSQWCSKQRWQMMEDDRLQGMTISRGPKKYQVWDSKVLDNKSQHFNSKDPWSLNI